MTQPPHPPDPYERYRVEEIQKDKQEKAGWDRKPQIPEKESGIGAHLLSMLRKFVDWFQGARKKLPASEAENIKKHLAVFKEILEILKEEDRSQETFFLNNFANTWHLLLDDALQLRKTAPLADRYLSFIQDVESYPEKTEHSLGYYLMEYKGQRWLPFPFMELVQKLHLDHKKNPKESKLTSWTTQIDSLIAELKD